MTPDEKHLTARCLRVREVLKIPVSVESAGAVWTGAGFIVRMGQTEVLGPVGYAAVAAYLDGVEHGAGWMLEHAEDTREEKPPVADLVTDPLSRLRGGLADDELIVRAAIGKRGSEAGAVVQHWQWERIGDDEVILTDGSAPIDAAYCYDDQYDRDKVDGPAILCTSERYPARVADWQLQDQLLPGVEEPHAGAAQHIARHDPARVLRQVEKLRAAAAIIQKLVDSSDRWTALWGQELALTLADIYPECTDETETPMSIAINNQKLQEIIDAEFARLTRESVEATAVTRDGTRTTVTVEVARIPDGEYAGEPVHIDCSIPVDVLEFDGRRFERRADIQPGHGVVTYWAEAKTP